jgi:hypothetical protein
MNSSQDVTINENKSGVFINLSFLQEEVINKLKTFLQYIQELEKILRLTENKKETFAKTYFEEEESSQENFQSTSV